MSCLRVYQPSGESVDQGGADQPPSPLCSSNGGHLQHIIIYTVSQKYNSTNAEVYIEICNSSNYIIIESDSDRSKH